jgi:hypothetical protein
MRRACGAVGAYAGCEVAKYTFGLASPSAQRGEGGDLPTARDARCGCPGICPPTQDQGVARERRRWRPTGGCLAPHSSFAARRPARRGPLLACSDAPVLLALAPRRRARRGRVHEHALPEPSGSRRPPIRFAPITVRVTSRRAHAARQSFFFDWTTNGAGVTAVGTSFLARVRVRA